MGEVVARLARRARFGGAQKAKDLGRCWTAALLGGHRWGDGVDLGLGDGGKDREGPAGVKVGRSRTNSKQMLFAQAELENPHTPPHPPASAGKAIDRVRCQTRFHRRSSCARGGLPVSFFYFFSLEAQLAIILPGRESTDGFGISFSFRFMSPFYPDA